MAELAEIRSGIAALLRDALAESRGHVSAYRDPNTKTPCLQVGGPAEDSKVDFADGRSYLIVVEALASIPHDIAAQKFLDEMMDLVPGAVEADGDANGALYSRLINGVVIPPVEASPDPAADSIAYEGFRGQGERTLDNGTQALVYSFAFRVLT